MWIWIAMLDLKAHAFKGREFQSWYGCAAIALVVGIALVTAASFYLNAVFAFSISHLGSLGSGGLRGCAPSSRRRARRRLDRGVALGISAVVVPRWGLAWFALSLGIVVGVMMLTYVSVPARIVGVRPTGSRRDRLAAAVVGGALGALVCTPPYVLGRIGILLLGTHALFALGVILLVFGLTLQAGATGAVKAIKMSAKLAAGRVAATAGSTGAPRADP